METMHGKNHKAEPLLGGGNKLNGDSSDDYLSGAGSLMKKKKDFKPDEWHASPREKGKNDDGGTNAIREKLEKKRRNNFEKKGGGKSKGDNENRAPSSVSSSSSSTLGSSWYGRRRNWCFPS